MRSARRRVWPQVLGLQLINYVDGAAMGSAGWAGVVARQTALHSMFSEHVLKPLVEVSWAAARLLALPRQAN
jgi:hypothetical protein